MASTTSSVSSDLVRQQRSPLYPLASMGLSGQHGKSIGSINMDELLSNIYAEENPAPSSVVFPPCEISNYDGNGEDEKVDVSGNAVVEGFNRKAVSEVWREVAGGRKMEYPEITLEDYLASAGVGRMEEVVGVEKQLKGEGAMMGVLMEPLALGEGYRHMQPQKAGDGAFAGFGNGLDDGGGRGRKRIILEEADKIAQQRQRRMIKNRESAARSRERKQAYTVELESLVAQLEQDNSMLKQQQEEQRRKRLKELMETRITVLERKRPQRCLRRTLSL